MSGEWERSEFQWSDWGKRYVQWAGIATWEECCSGRAQRQMTRYKAILETDRLLLREYVEEDAEAFFKLNSDPEVLRFVPDKQLLNVEQARQLLIDHPIADYRKHGFGRGACILKSTGEQIGFAGLNIWKNWARSTSHTA